VLVGNYIEGSDDETPQVVRELAERWPNVSAVVRPKEGMMGWDMRMGLNAAGRIPWRHRWRRAVSGRGCYRVSLESGDGRAGSYQDLSFPSRRRYLPANDLLHI